MRNCLPRDYLWWDPTPSEAGSPTVLNRGLPFAARGWRSYSLRNNPDGASSAEILTSFGCEVGFPVDDHDVPLSGSDIVLDVSPTIRFASFFFNGGVFASATTRARIAIYVEELDAGGGFVRGIDGQQLVLVDLSPRWVSGSVALSPSETERIIPTPDDRRIPARAGFQYIAWVDLWGEMQAAGFPPGPFGRSPFGSTAHVQVDLHVDVIRTSFFHRP